MNCLLTGFTAIAIAIAAGAFSGMASASSLAPSQQEQATTAGGTVIVPAAANPSRELAGTPSFRRGKVVAFSTPAEPGSVVIQPKKNRLYYVLGSGKAVMYRVATAKRGFEWRGTHRVSAKAKWPSWTPPAEMRKRRPALPVFMAGGPDNPLGARAL